MTDRLLAAAIDLVERGLTFERVLGPHLKYSCAWWPDGVRSLADAEARALDLTCERADIRNGQQILELGCGWGSLTLWIAERYPASRILAVSNSRRQRAAILERAAARGLANVEVCTTDMNSFTTTRRFDRIVSVEMFEHMRNFFSGGLMPGLSLLDDVESDLAVTARWTWDGTHYQKTANAWLRNLDASRDYVLERRRARAAHEAA